MKLQMSIKDFADRFGVTPGTIRKWELSGKIKPMRTTGGHRRYSEEDVRAVMGIKEKYNVFREQKRNIIYCRVSKPQNQDDLIKQVDGLKMFALGRGLKAEVIAEVGDGANISRPHFNKIVEDILNNKVSTLIVTQQDRLLHRGFELFENIAKFCGCEVIAVNDEL